jgi:virginiamycin B lyase
MRNIKVVLWLVVAVLCVTTSLAASDAVIKGAVTDSAGKPVRGAIVKATSGIKSVNRFTQDDGRYDIAVVPGTYDVTVDAYGYGVKRISVDTAKGEETNFRLASVAMDLGRLTGAEMEGLLPDSPQKKLLQATCVECHSFPTVIHRRGQSAAEWKAFLPHMTAGIERETFENAPPARLDALSAALEKYFGPNSPYFNPDADTIDPSKIKHVDPSDAALRATIVEYTIPTSRSRPHSITIDTKTDTAWFGEESFFGNKLTKFNMKTETFNEYPLLTEHMRPHTGGIAPDGTFWIALAHPGDDIKLASADPETGKVTQYTWPNGPTAGTHTLTFDRTGNIWFSGSPTGQLWAFDVKTKQFKTYDYTPTTTTVPKNSHQEWAQIPGQPEAGPNGGTYDVAVDNEGMIWFSQINIGTLLRLNPKTGETLSVHPEGAVNIRGITVDPDDNLWFGDFLGHRFGKMNVKTKEVKFYKPPTPNATAYGVAYNKADGSIWYADLNGNNVTRFNPKTEQFTEYRIPTRPDRAYDRFIGADSKGRMWFTEFFGDRIGYVDPSGEENSRRSASAK